MKQKTIITCLVIILLLVIDQAIKITVKTHMAIGDQIVVFDWFRILFIENNGMAWGLQLGSKLFLSLFRIVAVGFLIAYIHQLIKKGEPISFILVVATICAGAAGNIFDSLFFGQIFSESTPFSIASFVPWGDGYAPFLMGKVVDMFYFPLIHGTFLRGSLFGVGNLLCFSVQFSTLPTRVFL